MRKLLFILLLSSTAALGQPYGNEWLDFNKTYFKIKVAEDGIYRLSQADLASAGIAVGIGGIDPRRYQLFLRGQEVAIYVEGQNDGVFDPADYLEFYGQKNDGTLDANLYEPASVQPHAYYNLFSDTAAYFLTYHKTPSSGKRMTTLSPFTGVPLDAYHNATKLQLNTESYSRGFTSRNYTNLTQFDIGEGFTGERIREEVDVFKDYTLTGLNKAYVSGADPMLDILLAGRNNLIHDIEISVGPNTGSLVTVGTYQFTGYENYAISEVIAWSNISAAGELVVRITVIDNGDDNSNVSASYVRLSYQETFDMMGESQKVFDLEPNGVGGNEIQILNTPTNARVLDVTDPMNVYRVINTDIDPNTVKCGFSDASSARRLHVQPPTFITPSIEQINFRSIDASDAAYVVISHASLMQPFGVIPDAVMDYAGYRNSPIGGGYDTLVVEISQLYNQFSYGETTPLSIYNFMAWLVNEGDPEFLMLIGKGLDPALNYHRKDPATFTYHDLVPTAGSPGSDIPFTAGLNGTIYEPGVPTGRLSVSSPKEIIDYLNKVKEMESKPYDALWRKDILHLSGGKTSFEQTFFKSYMDGFGAIAEDVYLGGSVETISKATTSEVEFINVSEEVNNGLNLLNFFGHSAPNVTDVDIGMVSDPQNGYDNDGKYPMMIINGCNAASIYADNYLFAEDWLVTANKGAVGVIGHASFGYPNELRNYNNLLYGLAYGDSSFIDQPIGIVQKEVGKRLQEQVGPTPSYSYITQIQQMVLIGDPALSLFGTKTPDYAITNNDLSLISLDESTISSESDSIGLQIITKDLAAYYLDSIEISVIRTVLSDNSIRPIDTLLFPPVRYSDTLIFNMNNDFPNNYGQNQFEVILDPLNKLPEIDDFNNNRAVFVDEIPLLGTFNLAPIDFALVNKQPKGLVTQSGNLLAASRSYHFELDSTKQWGSPFFDQKEIDGKVIAQWLEADLPDISTLDSTAYYWRTKYTNPITGESDAFAESSFTYIENGPEGWGQLEYFQLDKNKLDGLQRNLANRSIDFERTSLSLKVQTYGANHPSLSYLDTELIVDGLPYIYGTGFTLCGNNRLNVVVFNNENAAPYAALSGNQENAWTCGRAPQIVNTYPAGKTLDEILDAIKVNETVLVFTIGSFDFNAIDPTTLAKLEDIGADMSVLTAKTATEPYILLGRKGIGGGNSFAELIADPSSSEPTDEQSIEFDGFVDGVFGDGQMGTSLIGPAQSWGKLMHKVSTPELTDSYGIDVIGVNQLGDEQVLFSDIQTNDLDLTTINAQTYPELKLNLTVVDTVNKTPPQLDYWLVTYDVPPEGILIFLGNDADNNLNISVQEGDSVKSQFGFVNLSEKAFTDSLLVVEYEIANVTQQKTISGNLKIKAPAPIQADTIPILIDIATKGLIGKNDLEVTVNPLLPEQYYQNNNLKLREYITVIGDETNPVLDVTFDGQYIFDGDIVSPNPEIAMIIRDQNPYLFKSDTTGIDIFHFKCSECPAARVNLSSSEISWTPATDKEPFKIVYSPMSLEDAMHKLEVNVEDASGNKSGTEPYSINFEVINKSSITHFYPYPNPFSTSVKFIFTLTGSDIPDEILIRIMTVSGRVVREITQQEIGPIRIGNNETAYAWDGRDEFGDQLANGVYLYKVYIQLNGQKIELRETAGDKGFTNGYGKLYLLK